jgi:hypothetical protein
MLMDVSRTRPPRRKSFNLVKKENRKKGFVYSFAAFGAGVITSQYPITCPKRQIQSK